MKNFCIFSHPNCYEEDDDFQLDYKKMLEGSRMIMELAEVVKQSEGKGKWKDKVAKIHKVEKELADQMDFRTKNFQYQSLPMADLIQHVFHPRDDHQFAYYLRWVGEDPRGQSKANFHLDFPSLAQDFQLPPELFFPDERFFSSVLRISSEQIRVWTHYDVMDNMYVQIVGKIERVLPLSESFQFLTKLLAFIFLFFCCIKKKKKKQQNFVRISATAS